MIITGHELRFAIALSIAIGATLTVVLSMGWTFVGGSALAAAWNGYRWWRAER